MGKLKSPVKVRLKEENLIGHMYFLDAAISAKGETCHAVKIDGVDWIVEASNIEILEYTLGGK
jgi:hypothetical protein